jgi:antitoxin component YwqK of YwqJK toxin-antitoxin module/uncharacterized membrane protein YhaH (DUF805 family)
MDSNNSKDELSREPQSNPGSAQSTGWTNWYFQAFRNYADFKGRARRREYLISGFFHGVVLYLFAFLDVILGLFSREHSVGLLSTLYALSMVVPMLSVSVRRLHDTGRSGRWLLVPSALGIALYLAVSSEPDVLFDLNAELLDAPWVLVFAVLFAVSQVWIFIVCLLDSTPGENQYGQNPKGVTEAAPKKSIRQYLKSIRQYLLPATIAVVIGVLIVTVWIAPEPGSESESEPQIDPDVVIYEIADNPLTDGWPPLKLSGRRSPAGKLNGQFTSSYEDTGNKQAEVFFNFGKEVGTWSIWDETGQLRRQLEFGEDGGCDETRTLTHRYKHCGEGLMTDWHANGQKAAEGRFIGLIEAGNPGWWPEAGVPVREKTGHWTEWYENGQKKSETIYAGPEQHFGGRPMSWDDHKIWSNYWNEHDEWVKSGKPIIGIDEWFENGQKKLKASYIDGQKDGEYGEWFENGQVKLKESYVDGNKDGEFGEWFENGQIKLKESYVDGKKDGEFGEWLENGQIMRKESYVDGRKEGEFGEWFENGQRKLEQHYINNELVSHSNSWFEDGQKQEEVVFEDRKFGRRYYPDGQIASEYVREKNTVNGRLYQYRLTLYLADGQKEREELTGDDPNYLVIWPFDDGKRIERQYTGNNAYVDTQWHPNGQKASVRQPTGKNAHTVTQWHPNGQKASEEEYKRGTFVRGTYWDENGVEQ